MSVFRLLARAAALTALTSSAWAAPFSVNVDGTATDVATGLVWDRCYVGQNLSDARCPVTATRSQVTWAEAFMLAESLNLLAYKGHADWRIPSIKELLSLRDLGRVVSPAIDLSAFPDAPPTQFWSSTTLASLPSSAWTVQFSFGDTVFGPKTDALHLRLVRGGATTAAFDALDTTAPVTTDGPTVVSPGIGGAQASASVTMNEDATGYWRVLPAGQPVPTPHALVSGGAPIALAAGASTGFSINGLTVGTTYVLYFIARDASSNLQPGVTATVFTVAGVEATAVPALSTVGLALLATLLGGLSWRHSSAPGGRPGS